MPSPIKSSPTGSKKPDPKGVAKGATPAVPTAKVEVPAAKPVLPTPSTGKIPAPAERTKMIAEAAYYLAQKRGFSHGHDLSDWVAAEKQVEALLKRRG